MAEALEIHKKCCFQSYVSLVTSNLWTTGTLLLFTAQLSVQPFHTMKEHDSVKGVSECFTNLKNKLAKFSFISFISILLPFCKKPSIFFPSSVARLSVFCLPAHLHGLGAPHLQEPGSGWVWGTAWLFLTLQASLVSPGIFWKELSAALGMVSKGTSAFCHVLLPQSKSKGTT